MTSIKPSLWERLTCGPLTANDRRNQWVATGWLFVWQVLFVGAAFLLEEASLPDVATWAAVAVPTIVGIGAFIVYRRFVTKADELQKKIQLDAMAIGFGAGVISAVTFQLMAEALDRAIDPVNSMMVAVVAYAASVVVATKRYA